MARNTGKRPHEIALEVLKPGVTITPSELEKHVGNGPYASKHIWFLRKLGHDITVNKDGRTVVSYTYNGSGTAQSVPAKPATAPAKAKPAKAKTAKPSQPAQVADEDEDDVPVMDRASRRPSDDVEDTFGSTGALSAVDPDWDSTEGIDLKKLI